MLSPSEHWCWTCCPQRQQLVLDMSAELAFPVPFGPEQLHLPASEQAFTMQDAERYWQLLEVLEQGGLDAEQRLYFTLTALAAINFMRAQGHKSWYFADIANHRPLHSLQLVELVGQQGVLALVLTTDGQCAQTLLLQPAVTLTGKALAAGTVLRLLTSRLRPYQAAVMRRSA
ncbi:MAG: cell division protein ZapC [Alkalimonas sp.]|nr:cell division protein ZapC [Alkalimonas sp.]